MGITVNDSDYNLIGNRACRSLKISMGSSYPTGGEPFDIEALFGIHNVDLCMVNPVKGVALQYAAGKVKAFKPAPPIVYEEKCTPVGDTAVQTITTKYPPAFFINAARLAQNKTFRSTGVTPGDDQISLVSQMAEGTRAVLSVKDKDRLLGQGAFAADTGWTGFAADDWEVADAAAKKNADGTTALVHGTNVVAGSKYLLEFTVTDYATLGFTPSIGATNGEAVTANGTYSMLITAADTTPLTFTPAGATSRFFIKAATVYRLTGEPVYLTYVTQAWKEVWENVVQDEDVVVASGATSCLANSASAIMYADRTSATAAAMTLIDEDDTAASGEIAVYLNQALTNIKASNANENGKTVRFTYLKTPASGFLADRAFDNEAATKAGGDPFTNTFDYPILLWGYTGQVPVNGGVTQRLLPYLGTPAAGNGVLDWFTPGIRGAAAPLAGTVFGCKSDVTVTGAGIWGALSEIPQGTLEVPNGEDLSVLGEFDVMIIGI